MTKEQLKEQLKATIDGLFDYQKREILREFQIINNDCEQLRDMDEFDGYFYADSLSDVISNLQDGFNINDDYFMETDLGHIKSYEYIDDYLDEYFHMDEIIDYIIAYDDDLKNDEIADLLYEYDESEGL